MPNRDLLGPAWGALRVSPDVRPVGFPLVGTRLGTADVRLRAVIATARQVLDMLKSEL